jgi:tetratricopeptide (TPR) repeat protein
MCQFTPLPKTKLLLWLWLVMGALQVLAHPELDEQIRLLTAQLELQPNNPELYLRRADVRRQHAEFELALSDIATAARLKPGWSKVSLAQAQTLFDASRTDDAQKAVEEFLLAEPHHATALVLRGRCKLKLGKLEQTVADYSAALNEFAQPSPDLYVERARLQASMGRFDEAVRGLDEGAARLAGAPTLQLASIEYERQRGNFAAAVERADKLLGAVRQSDILLLRAQLLEQAGRLNEAQKAFQEILTGTASRAPGIRLTEALSTTRQRATEGLARVEAKLLRSELAGGTQAARRVKDSKLNQSEISQ